MDFHGGDVLDRATRALHFTGTASLEQAIDWIMKHQDDPDVDDPLLVDKVGHAWMCLRYLPFHAGLDVCSCLVLCNCILIH